MSSIEVLQRSLFIKYDGGVATRASSEPTNEALAAEVWQRMAEFTFARMQASRGTHALKALGLTPGHVKVLTALQPGEALPMGAVADMLSVDPSIATSLVDRLEDRRLVDRKMLSTDRRVKVVSLTARGERVKARVLGDLLTPPEELLALDRDRLEALQVALSALPRPERPWIPGRPLGRGRPRGGPHRHRSR